MAKGDDARTRAKLDYNQDRGEQLYSSAAANVGAQGQAFQQGYGNAMQSDQGMRDQAFSGYKDFATTGGFNPSGIAAKRSRAISPIRAAYSNAERNVNRMGSIPGKATLTARMAREQGQAASDATTGVEANLAQLVQQGKLAGNAGISQLYGTTPGQTGLFTNAVLQNTNQGIDLLQGENNRMQGIADTTLGLTKAPGKMDTALNQVLQAQQIGKNIFKPRLI